MVNETLFSTGNLQIAQPASSLESLIVRPIASEHELNEVYRLTHDCYVPKGYSEAQPDGKLAHYPSFDRLPETTILGAFVDNRLVGSESFTIDGPAGFTIEDDFAKECRQAREEGRSLATVWRLVIEDLQRLDRQIVIALIDKMICYSALQGVNTWFFVVNPRHVSVYQRLFNSTIVARKESTRGLDNAPAVLIRGDLEHLPGRWTYAKWKVSGRDMVHGILRPDGVSYVPMRHSA